MSVLAPNTDVAPWSRPTKYSTTSARNAVNDSHSAALVAEKSMAVARVLGASGVVMRGPFRDVASQSAGADGIGSDCHSGATVLESHQIPTTVDCIRIIRGSGRLWAPTVPRV